VSKKEPRSNNLCIWGFELAFDETPLTCVYTNVYHPLSKPFLYFPKCHLYIKSEPERIFPRMSLEVWLVPLLYRFVVASADDIAHDSAVWPRVSRVRTSLIRNPLPQKEARHRPIMAITTTEQAAGTAWLLPRN